MGASVYSDTLLIAMQIVWLLETVLISSAVVPVIVSRIYQVDEREGGEAAIALFLHAALVCCGIAIFASGLGLIFVDQLSATIAPGLNSYGRQTFGTLLLVSAATPLLLALSHFLGLLNRLLRNGVWYSVPQIVRNTTAIAGLIAGYTFVSANAGAHWMMIGLSIGALIVCFIQLWALPRVPRTQLFQGFRGHVSRAMSFRGRWPFWSGVSALAFVALVNELYVYIDFYFASKLDEGSISLLGFAGRLAALTNTLVVGSAFVILEPRWAKQIAAAGSAAWRSVVRPDMLSLVALISVPVAILYTFPGEVTAIIYNSDEFTPVSRERIVLLTQIFAFGTVALALNLITTRAVVIALKQRWLFVISLSLLPVKVVLNLLVVDDYGVAGLAMATVAVIFLQALGNAIVLMQANLNFGLRSRDALALVSVFAIALMAAQGLASVVGDGMLSLLLACLILPCVVFGMGVIYGFSFISIFSQGVRPL